MRLGILIYSLSGGGAERVVSYLVSFCVQMNIEVHLILMNDTIDYELPPNLNIHYIEKSAADEKGVLKALKIPLLAYKYFKMVKKLQLTHSLSFLTRPSFINVISGKLTSYRYKIIVNERAHPSLQYSYKGFQSSFNKAMIRLLYKKADIVISNSFGNAEDLLTNFNVPQTKMKVIHNPISIERISTIEPKKTMFDSESFNIITLGRLDIGKNHEMLIRSVHQLQNPSVRLYIYGYGDLESYLQQLIDELKLNEKVKLMGFDPNPYQYLKSADLFIFGSNHEGFPNVLLEAMACGLPILTTNCQSGPNEIMKLKEVKNDLMITDYGILVPIKNTDLMAKGIKYFMENPDYSDKCKLNGSKRVLDFEKNQILKEYLEIIKTA